MESQSCFFFFALVVIRKFDFVPGSGFSFFGDDLMVMVENDLGWGLDMVYRSRFGLKSMTMNRECLRLNKFCGTK